MLHGENAAEFERLEAALIEELAPEGVLQSLLAQRVAAAVWRLGRAEQIETQLFAENSQGARALGLALIRDCNRSRSLETLLRYRGGTLAEFWRALRTLKALQAEVEAQATAQQDAGTAPAPARAAVPVAPAPMLRAPAPALAVRPDEPESLENSGDSGRASNPPEQNAEPGPAWPLPRPLPGRRATPIEPESRRNLGASVPQAAAEIAQNGRASLLAGTALARPPAASLGSTGG